MAHKKDYCEEKLKEKSLYNVSVSLPIWVFLLADTDMAFAILAKLIYWLITDISADTDTYQSIAGSHNVLHYYYI